MVRALVVSHSLLIGNAPQTFALKQQNLQLLTKTVLEVSDPNNVRYG